MNSYSCACLRGYEGQNCAVDIDECGSSPCLNGSGCSDGDPRLGALRALAESKATQAADSRRAEHGPETSSIQIRSLARGKVSVRLTAREKRVEDRLEALHRRCAYPLPAKRHLDRFLTDSMA
jgi:hypothetical protein